MQYSFDVAIPKNTLASDPVRVSAPLNKGQLSKVSVLFPKRCANLAYVRILHYEHQLYPTNPDAWLSGDGVLIEFDCAYEVDQGYTEFKVEGYNEDDFYEHTPIVSFVVLPVLGLYQRPIAWAEG